MVLSFGYLTIYGHRESQLLPLEASGFVKGVDLAARRLTSRLKAFLLFNFPEYMQLILICTGPDAMGACTRSVLSRDDYCTRRRYKPYLILSIFCF